MPLPIVDLHCDLLSFLAEKEGRTVDDPGSRCSFPQLSAGGVHLQVVALFTETGPRSVHEVEQQLFALLRLLQTPRFTAFSSKKALTPLPIALIPAFENASGFASEEEPLQTALARLEQWSSQIGPPLYITLTWNQENRFGGGDLTRVGLKEDGKRLIDFLEGKQIAIDLSHASDWLAYEVIDYIDKHALNIPLIASHSNFRAKNPHLRNLPDPLAQEIIRRKGVIGLNFFGPFVHDSDPLGLLDHIEHALHLGGEESLCFGADFFCIDDFTALQKKYQNQTLLYPELANATVYPSLLQTLHTRGSMSMPQIEKLASGNALAWLARHR